MSEHVILTAWDVEAPDRATALQVLLRTLKGWVPLGPGPYRETSYVEAWWTAEDDRTDQSDNDSAVFVPQGTQAAVSRHLIDQGLTPEWNVTPDIIRQAALMFLHGEDPAELDLAALADALGVDHGEVEALGGGE